MRLGLLREEGVTFADVDWQSGEASVVYDPAVTSPEALVASEIFSEPTARHHYRASRE